MSRIFISYARRDLEIVDSIVEKLEAAGLGLWIDREAIKAGKKTWRVQIVEAIATCDAFVLMLSSNSTASDNVRREIDLAQDAGCAIFIMKLDSVKLPAEMLYQLVGLQHLELQKLGMEEGIHRLIDSLDEHLATWKPDKDQTVRRVELVFQDGTQAEFGEKKRTETLGLISTLTETPASQLDFANLEAGSVHVFVDMPAAAAFELKTRALNRDRQLKRSGVKSLRIAGDRQYVNISLGLFNAEAAIGALQELWRNLPSLFSSLFGVAVGKIIVITTVVAVTTAGGIALAAGLGSGSSPAQPTPSATNAPIHDAPSPTSDGGFTVLTSTPTSTSNPTIPPVETPVPSQTGTPTPYPTNTSTAIPSTSVPFPTPTSTMIPTALPLPAIPTETPPSTATYTPIPSDTPTPTATETATATIMPPANEPPWTGGWTHINPGPGEIGSGQTLMASDTNLLTVDVSILTGNPGRGDDTLTLKILSADQQVLGTSSQLVADGFEGWLQFQFPGAGLLVTPGETLIIALADTGTTTFGWKYALDTYSNGHAIMVGTDQPSYDFFFRINP